MTGKSFFGFLVNLVDEKFIIFKGYTVPGTQIYCETG